MFATLGGSLALLQGLVVLLVPLLAPELSRARDAVWGAVMLLLGLVLVTSSDRLGGSPMVAVLCGGLLIGRLGSEVGQQRWRALTPEEQQRLGSGAHWLTALGQVLASLGALQGMASQSLSGLLARRAQAAGSSPTAFKEKGKGKPGGQTKRWVRPEATTEATAANPAAGDQPANASGNQASPETTVPPGGQVDLEPAPALQGPPPEPQQALAEFPSGPPPATPASVAPGTPQTGVIEVSSFTEIEALIDAAWGEAPQSAQAAGEPAPLAGNEPTQAPDASPAAAASPTSPFPPQVRTDGAATSARNEAG